MHWRFVYFVLKGKGIARSKSNQIMFGGESMAFPPGFPIADELVDIGRSQRLALKFYDTKATIGPFDEKV